MGHLHTDQVYPTHLLTFIKRMKPRSRLSIIRLVDQGEEPVALDSNEVAALEGAHLAVEGVTHEVVQEDMAVVASTVVEEVPVVVAIAVDGKIGKRWGLGSKNLMVLLMRRGKTSRVREGSVIIDPNWRMLEEVDFLRLNKLRLEVDPAETL
jgi:hypothetical protein